jgi:hypothetical protein
MGGQFYPIPVKGWWESQKGVLYEELVQIFRDYRLGGDNRIINGGLRFIRFIRRSYAVRQ